MDKGSHLSTAGAYIRWDLLWKDKIFFSQIEFFSQRMGFMFLSEGYSFKKSMSEDPELLPIFIRGSRFRLWSVPPTDF